MTSFQEKQEKPEAPLILPAVDTNNWLTIRINKICTETIFNNKKKPCSVIFLLFYLFIKPSYELYVHVVEEK